MGLNNIRVICHFFTLTLYATLATFKGVFYNSTVPHVLPHFYHSMYILLELYSWLPMATHLNVFNCSKFVPTTDAIKFYRAIAGCPKCQQL